MLKHNRGYTLVEMLMATVLTLMMMSAVVRLFESVGRGISDSRALLGTNDRLRMAALQLQRDLGGVTVPMLPPRRPENNEGYFEYTEGPIGPVVRPEAVFVDAEAANVPDTTIIDNDDMLMMTVRSEEPFVGRHYTAAGAVEVIQSQYAEVAWFVRGRTLYRRVLLVSPIVALNGGVAGFYANNDISVRLENGALVTNTLGDLTKPESRFAHRPQHAYPAAVPNPSWFPFHPHFPINWNANAAGLQLVNRTWARLGLPTLQETSAPAWNAGMFLPNAALNQNGQIDLWTNPYYWNELNQQTGTLNAYQGNRIGEDIVLTNVIGFDVKAWDPGAPTVMDATGTVALVPGDPGYLAALRTTLPSGDAIVAYGAYVDLNYMCSLRGAAWGDPNYAPVAGAPVSDFFGAGQARSGIRGTEPNLLGTTLPAAAILADIFNPANFPPDDIYRRDSVYDTWSSHYENDGIPQFPTAGIPADTGVNGLDDNTYDMQGTSTAPDGVVDGPNEMDTRPPYPAPLRGIQVTIRVYEPSTRQVRQRTIQQDFLAR